MFGDTVLVGAPYDTVIAGLDRHGAAGAFGTPQLLLDGPPGPNQRFGERVALQGNLALVGSPFFSLPVAVFERRGAEDWGPDDDADGGVDPSRMLAAGAPQASNAFGGALAVWGDTALVGASLHDSTSPTAVDAGAAFAFRLGAIDPADHYDPLTLTSPPGGTTRYPLEPVTIAWTGGLPEWDIEINLVQTAPGNATTLVDAEPNDAGTYEWVLLSDLACGAGHRYQFTIQQQGNPSTLALGADFDVLCPPPLSFTSPPPGSSFIPGDPVTISWSGGAPRWILACDCFKHRQAPFSTASSDRPQIAPLHWNGRFQTTWNAGRGIPIGFTSHAG